MIVVFGSINVDLVIRVPALPQPGETVLSGSYDVVPGGKGGNTALAAARAGASTGLFGAIGNDSFGADALVMLRAGGVDLSGVAATGRPTGCAMVWVDDSGENAIVVASGANLDVRADQAPDRVLTSETIVALQMEVPPAENWRLVERAKRLGARVLLNVAPAGAVPGEILSLLDFVVFNEAEAGAFAARAGLGSIPPHDFARGLAGRYGTTCIVTLGSRGAVSFGPDGGLAVPALPVEPVDTTAAGDAFCGVFAAALDCGAPIESALRYAAVGAGLACTAAGAQSSLPGADAIEDRLRELPATRRLSG